MKTINTIDDVIAALEEIIIDSKYTQDPLGYFAVLYQRVTIKVKEGIENGFFDDGERMEQLDVVFAKRYLQAYQAFHRNEPITASWKSAFEQSISYQPIVLQHLLIGINAHINLDLGIAAAAISNAHNIDDLENDFNKINAILSSLVNEVEQKLSEIWPTLKYILKKVKRLDDFLVDFSMKIARDGAWKFAKSIVDKTQAELDLLINKRDEKVARKANIVLHPGLIIKLILMIVRLGERGSVSEKIQELAANALPVATLNTAPVLLNRY